MGSISDLNLAVVRCTIVQLTHCRFGVVKEIKSLSAAEACTDICHVYISLKYYSS
jgi:hypothetical protein